MQRMRLVWRKHKLVKIQIPESLQKFSQYIFIYFPHQISFPDFGWRQESSLTKIISMLCLAQQKPRPTRNLQEKQIFFLSLVGHQPSHDDSASTQQHKIFHCTSKFYFTTNVLVQRCKNRKLSLSKPPTLVQTQLDGALQLCELGFNLFLHRDSVASLHPVIAIPEWEL